MELKVIYLPALGLFEHEKEYDYKKFDYKTLENPYNYIKTMIGTDNELIMDTNKRKSFTYNKRLILGEPKELLDYFNGNSILHSLDGLDYANCEILKYEVGDFFVSHRDTVMNDCRNIGEHKYTCLIYGTFEQENGYFEGGELVFKHPEGLYNIKIDLSNEIKNNKYIAVIFSVDMYHEILPVKNGTRYVLKKPLFVKTCEPAKVKNIETDVDDGGFQSGVDMFGQHCDY
jgi:Rps23 Pro-64 3,4-dihydroxylase Tpa1-like proline 4-hydroxylase